MGYVSTAYCERPIEKVFADVAQYSNWSQNESLSGLAVSGIFFDETPNVFSRKKKEYLDAITECVKGSIGILGTKTVFQRFPVKQESKAEKVFRLFITREHRLTKGSQVPA